MKKLSYILHGLLLAICMTMNGCMKDVYKGPDNEEEKEKPEPSIPDEKEDDLPDFSVPKVFDWNEVYIKIPVAAGTNIDNIQVCFPQLKYNKKFAYSYTFDDCTVMAYSRGFCLINLKSATALIR